MSRWSCFGEQPVTTFTGPPAESEAGIGAVTLGGLLAETRGAHGELEAVAARSANGSVTRWTYDDLWHESRRYAKGLLATGVGRGTRVGILVPNRAEWLAAAFGVALCGGVLGAPRTVPAREKVGELIAPPRLHRVIPQPRLAPAPPPAPPARP